MIDEPDHSSAERESPPRRRRSLPRVRIRFVDEGRRFTYQEYDPLLQHDDGSELYTVSAVLHFLRFFMDFSRQTDFQEYQIFPMCLAALTVDAAEEALAQNPDDSTAHLLLDSIGRELSKLTRASDRAGRYERTFYILLSNTIAKNAAEHYSRRTTEYMRAISEVMGMPTTFSIGIASLTEHAVKNATDLLAKAECALGVARDRGEQSTMKGFACVAVYDFRTMPLSDEGAA